MTFPLVYDRPTSTARGPQPGATALMAWCLGRWPTSTNLGIYNPRNVRGGSSLSTHAEGRAIDVGFPYTIGGTPEGWDCAETLRKHSTAFGVQQIIYSRRIWTNTRDAEGWRYYAGTAAHYEHVHAELTRQAARELTTEMIAALEPKEEDDDMTARIIAAYIAGGRDRTKISWEEVCIWVDEIGKNNDPEGTLSYITWAVGQ